MRGVGGRVLPKSGRCGSRGSEVIDEDAEIGDSRVDEPLDESEASTRDF